MPRGPGSPRTVPPGGPRAPLRPGSPRNPSKPIGPRSPGSPGGPVSPIAPGAPGGPEIMTFTTRQHTLYDNRRKDDR